MERVPTALGPACTAWSLWGRWTEFDKPFEKIDIERWFRVAIRAEEVDRESNFTVQAEDRLPLMMARNEIVFWIGPFSKK